MWALPGRLNPSYYTVKSVTFNFAHIGQTILLCDFSHMPWASLHHFILRSAINACTCKFQFNIIGDNGRQQDRAVLHADQDIWSTEEVVTAVGKK